MPWTPASGALELRENDPGINDVLCKILRGERSNSALSTDPAMIPVLFGIGGNHALKLLEDRSGRRLSYWPRVWSARALARIGDSHCVDALHVGAGDDHWRVRMQSMRAAGLIAEPEDVDRLATRLVFDQQPRVRMAVALAIGRKGSAGGLSLLGELAQDGELGVRQAAERAIASLQSRLS